MKVKNIIFLKVSNETIAGSFSFVEEGGEHFTIRMEGASRAQCVYNMCKQGKLDWNLFVETKALAMTKADPRFRKVERRRYQSPLDSRREQRFADICDDLRCSRSEAVAFLDKDTMPRGW